MDCTGQCLGAILFIAVSTSEEDVINVQGGAKDAKPNDKNCPSQFSFMPCFAALMAFIECIHQACNMHQQHCKAVAYSWKMTLELGACKLIWVEFCKQQLRVMLTLIFAITQRYNEFIDKVHTATTKLQQSPSTVEELADYLEVCNTAVTMIGMMPLVAAHTLAAAGMPRFDARL
eukprot:1160026-Pelagomonas_calceolata.AAC.5